MQENFTIKLQMTNKRICTIAKCVKILEDAVKKYGSIPDFQRALAREGVDITLTALYNAQKGIAKSLKPDVTVAIAYLVYNGDGKEFLKAMSKDFMPPGLRK